MIAQELKDYFRETLVAQRTIAQEFAALDALVDFVSQNDHTSIPDWTSGLTFQLDGSDDGAFCTEPDTNGRIRFFKTKVNNNTGNSPPTDPLITENTYWIEVSPSDGSSVKEWAVGVYGSGLVIVYFDTSGTGADPDLYVLAEPTRPFNSTNFTTELAAGKWKRMQTVFDVAGTGGTDVMNIGTTNADVINIGRVGATVNIYGNTIYSQVTNLEVSDKLIRLNRGGAAASAGGSGFELEENSVVTGYIKTSSDRNSYELKVPNVAYKASFNFSTLAADRSYTLPNNSGTLALLSDIGGGGWSLASGGTLIGDNTITGTGFKLKGVWNGLTNTQTNGYGWWLANTTAALVGSQVQNSPSMVKEGQVWDTTNTITRSIRFAEYVSVAAGTQTENTLGYRGTWTLASSRDGAAYANRLTVDSLGTVVIDGVFGQNSFTYKTGGLTFFGVDSSGMTYTTSSSIMAIGTTSNSTARLKIVEIAQTSAWRKVLELNPGAHTLITNTLEHINVDLATVTQSWAGGGTVATQRNVYLRSQTLAGSSAQTFTNAYTLYIDSPIQGTNATITNNYALGVNGSINVIGSYFMYDKGSGATVTKVGIGINTNAAIYWHFNTSSSDVFIAYNSTPSLANVRAYLNSGGKLGLGPIGALPTAQFHLVQPAQSSSWEPICIHTPGAHTLLTAAQLARDLHGASWSWASGTGLTQIFTHFKGWTTNTSGSATITTAYNVFIDGITNGTITPTNKFALGLSGDMITNGSVWAGSVGSAGRFTPQGTQRYTEDSYMGMWGGTAGVNGVVVYGASHATKPDVIELATSGNISFFTTNDADYDGAAKVIRIGARTTAPSGTQIADHAYLFVQDIAAGNAAVHVQTEAGDLVKLCAISGWGTPTNTLTRTTFDTSTVTLQQLAERVGALISDLKTGHGFLKA